MVQLREAVAPSLVYRVPRLGPPNQGIVEESWEGLQVAEPKGTVGEVVVEGGGHWGRLRVPGGHEGGL